MEPLCLATSVPIKPRIVILLVSVTGWLSMFFHEFTSVMLFVMVGS
jgi:hypothetical protein